MKKNEKDKQIAKILADQTTTTTANNANFPATTNTAIESMPSLPTNNIDNSLLVSDEKKSDKKTLTLPNIIALQNQATCQRHLNQLTEEQLLKHQPLENA